MSVDRSITSCSSQILTLSVGNVFAISLDITLGQSKINEENFVTGFVKSNAEVIWLDVPVDKVPVVNILNSGHHLIN